MIYYNLFKRSYETQSQRNRNVYFLHNLVLESMKKSKIRRYFVKMRGDVVNTDSNMK